MYIDMTKRIYIMQFDCSFTQNIKLTLNVKLKIKSLLKNKYVFAIDVGINLLDTQFHA